MRPQFTRPYAIAMWDFSWLERRWPGAGFEDWDQALSELTDRGYDAVRIDAFPHLVATDPEGDWQLLPRWNQQSWGAASIVTVRPLPALLEFLRAAQKHKVSVSLSSWFREDWDNVRVTFNTPEKFAEMWIATLKVIENAGLLDTILFADLCNEFPLRVWAPWLYTERRAKTVFRGELKEPHLDAPGVALGEASRREQFVANWMRRTIALVRTEFPDLDLTYSFSSELATWRHQDVETLDVLEPHIWLANNEYTDFYDRVGYHFEPFSSTGYDNLVTSAKREYLNNSERYDTSLFRMIDTIVEWSRTTGKALYITECWSLVDYKDWPGLDWDWILDINAKAVEYAVTTGRFVGIATSNFCAPQFVGMWREVEWHRRLTDIIKAAPIDADIRRV